MDNRLSISLNQLVALLLLAIFAAAGLSAAFMILGWQLAKDSPSPDYGADLEVGSQPARLTDSGVTLPHAMTATPRDKQPRTISFTNESLLVELQRQVDMSEAQVELQLQSIHISEAGIVLNGWVEDPDPGGPWELSGNPVIHEGRLQLNLQDLRLAGQKLPEFVTAALDTEIQQVFGQWLWGYEILELKLVEGKIDLIVVDW